MTVTIQRADAHQLDSLAKLFDAYRVFYEQKADLEGAKLFLKQRIQNDESVIFLASVGERPVGFVQLYPAFSSVSLKRSWILNDLFVEDTARKKGAGEALMKAAISFARNSGAKSLSLETAEDNLNAQRLYERLGFVQETNRFYYLSV